MYHWHQFKCKEITLPGVQKFISSIHSRTQGHEQIEKQEWRKVWHKQHYTWRQASERKVCTHLWEYYLIQQVDRPTQPHFSIRCSCSENSFLYSIPLARQCPWWHFVMTSFGKGHYNKFHFFSGAWSLPLSWNRAASPRCWAWLMISDISLIITSPRHHHLSSQVWSLINNPWGRVVASQACHMICSLMRSSHNQQ